MYGPRKCCSVGITAEEPLIVGGGQKKATKHQREMRQSGESK